MTIKAFSELYNNTKYATIPEHARPNRQFKENSANELTKAVLAWFELNKIHAFRQSSEGRYLAPKTVTNVIGKVITLGTGKYIPRSKGAKGSADIAATIPPLGRRLEVEIKYGKDRQSDFQKDFQKEVESMGGIYIIVKTWDGFLYDINRIIAQQQLLA